MINHTQIDLENNMTMFKIKNEVQQKFQITKLAKEENCYFNQSQKSKIDVQITWIKENQHDFKFKKKIRMVHFLGIKRLKD